MKRFLLALCIFVAGCGSSGDVLTVPGYGPPPQETPNTSVVFGATQDFPVMADLPNGCGPMAATSWLWMLGPEGSLSPTPDAMAAELYASMDAVDLTSLGDFTRGINTFLLSRNIPGTLYVEAPATSVGFETAKSFLTRKDPVWLMIEFDDGRRHYIAMTGFNPYYIQFEDSLSLFDVGRLGSDPLYLYGYGAKIVAIIYFLKSN